MKNMNKLMLVSFLIVCLFTSITMANENVGTAEVTKLDNRLSDVVDEFNKIVTDENSSFEEVQAQVELIMQIEDELEDIGMVVNFEPTSGVHKNKKNEVMPATMSFKIVSNSDKKSKESQEAYVFEMNEGKKEVLGEIYGTDITMGEYIEIIFPEALDVLPKKTLNEYYKTPMTWSNNPYMCNESLSSTYGKDKSSDDIMATSTTYSVLHSSDLSVLSSSSVKFKSTSVVISPYYKCPIPEMEVFSYLWKTSQTVPQDSVFKVGYNTGKVEASKEKTVISGSYYTQGNHFCVYPLGCWPLYASAVSTCDVKPVGAI
ncbi:MAG: hypothetical protein AWU59_453 [Methanolobus sp. T82-4]|jgi:hypothetical protein|nr:MAG: hypothetical protein AWU59_453 [Methanolobus sp. T82-4]